MTATSEITGLILAGGAGRRVGGRDKGLIQWRGEALAAQVARRLRPQVCRLLISCNRNPGFYAALADATVADRRGDYQGPLAGLEAAGQCVATRFLVIAPCDVPLLPPDLAQRLTLGLAEEDADIAWVHDGIRDQYLCAALRSACLADLGHWLDQGHRTVRHWYRNYRCTAVDFSTQPTAFRNINRV